jgi:hypothetical protein
MNHDSMSLYLNLIRIDKQPYLNARIPRVRRIRVWAK